MQYSLSLNCRIGSSERRRKFPSGRFQLADKIQSVTWLDNGETVSFIQNSNDVVVTTVPYTYGRNLVVRVAKIVCN